jgi:hypothetical protein
MVIGVLRSVPIVTGVPAVTTYDACTDVWPPPHRVAQFDRLCQAGQRMYGF